MTVMTTPERTEHGDTENSNRGYGDMSTKDYEAIYDTNGNAYYDDINDEYVYPVDDYNEWAYERLPYHREM